MVGPAPPDTPLPRARAPGPGRPRVLIIAEAANPEWVSVPLIGWFLSQAIADVADAHVVTQIRNADAFERAGLVEGQDFTAIDSEKLNAPAYRWATRLAGGQGKGWTLLQAAQSLIYPHFERLVWRRFGAAIARGDYDIVHRITPMSPTSPSPLAGKCRRAGVPFIVGPLNGGLPWPRAFTRARWQEHEWLSYLRGLYKLLPHHRAMMSNAAAIIVGSRHTATEIPAKYHHKTIYIPESAVDLSRFSLTGNTGQPPPLRGCFIGRMVPYKGPDMLLEAALPHLQAGTLKLDMVGDGPLMETIRRFVSTHRIEHAVTLWGWVPHKDLQGIAARSDIFAFPSIREFGGTSILETMAIGLVPVIVDYGGPGDNITNETGFKIPLAPRSELIDSLRQTLGDIIARPEMLPAMRARGHARIKALFTWPRRAEQMREIYDWVLHPDRQKPAPFDPR